MVTASSDNNDYLYVQDSSSGSENFILDHMIVREVDGKRRSNLDSHGGSSSASSHLHEDNSGDELDPELRPADYWTCVKCKNRQNNPLYRYCEKCYQVSRRRGRGRASSAGTGDSLACRRVS